MHRIAIEGRPSSRGELATWYSAVLEQQATSGLSVTDFAEEVGVSPCTLYQWRRRLSAAIPNELPPPQLIEVAIARPESSSDSGLVVRLGDGRRSIAVPAGFDGDELRRLVTALEKC